MADNRKVVALAVPKAAEPASAILDTDGPDPQFLHSVLCQVSLPRNPTRETMFTRSCGQVSITLQAGPLFDGVKMVPQPLPSGTRPRLVLLHICSQAVKTRSAEVAIGQSVRGFLRELHIDAGGENMRQFRVQMKALAACHMILGAPSPEGPVTLAAKPVERFTAWTTDDEGQYTAWGGRLILGRAFFDQLVEHAVPLDPEAIAKLKNTSLGLDCYAWLSHRLCRVRSDQGVRLSWNNLHQQFGTEYRDRKNFKTRFLEALRKAVAAYPAARVDQVRGGLRLLPSPPPIARKAVVVKLPAPAEEPPRGVSELPLRHRITEDGLDRLRDACPGWDRQWLLLRYLEFMADKPTPKNADASLVAWGRKFTKGRRPA
jgi:replication initiator protein